MARADLLVTLVRAARKRDDALFQRTVEALIAEERANQHHVLADRLEENLRQNGNSPVGAVAVERDVAADVGVLASRPTRTLDELVLPRIVRRACEGLIEEQH